MEEQFQEEESRDVFAKGMILGFFGAFLLLFLVVFTLQQLDVFDASKAFYRTSHKSLEKRINKKVNLLEAYIDKFYLNKIDDDTMAEEVYKGVINGLGDDYGEYYTKEEYENITQKSDGVYCGIGVTISQDAKTGVITVLQTSKNGPAQKAGIQEGDQLYAINGMTLFRKDISQVQALIKGGEDSRIKVTVLRDNKRLQFKVKRKDFEEKTVFTTILSNRIGYMQVTGFKKVTRKQFSKAIKKMKKKNVKALIIDLRNNGGGLLDIGVDMLDEMLPKGLVVYSKDKEGNTTKEYAKSEDSFDKPVAILVNENSASCSEVFAGAMQDKERAVLVGTKTFGKGIVQGVFKLEDGSALKMTISKYYTPKGRNIHGKGLTPDILVELNDKKTKDRKTGKELDNQLKKAVEYLQEKCS